MKITKLKIKQIQKLQENAEIESRYWMITDGQIISYDVEQKDVFEESINDASEFEKQILEEAKQKKEEEWVEFVEKSQIRHGLHKIDHEKGMVEIPRTEEIFFETTTSIYLKKLFLNFFNKSELLKDKFKKNKRAYLLHSDPGMGKSALIRNFCEHALKIDGTAVLMVDGDVNFNSLSNIFIRPYAKNVQRIILVIEDFGKKDAAAQGTMYNPSCLNFLDGTAGLFRVPTMILCTTNFAKDLGPQLTNRPGRFNKIIKVLPPSDKEIFQLVEGIGNIKLSEDQKKAFRGRNMTPDHVIEAIIRHELEDITLVESVNEVMGERAGIVDWNK